MEFRSRATPDKNERHQWQLVAFTEPNWEVRTQ